MWNKKPKGLEIWYITGVKNLEYEKIITDLIPMSQKGKALDLGCGEGFYSEYLRKKGYFTIGIDNNEEMLKRAIGKYNKLFKLDVQNGLPFPNNCFNLVLAIYILEHLKNPVKTIKEIRRVLKKGGRAIIAVPNGMFNFEFFFQGHKHILSENIWKKLLKDFKILSIKHAAIIPLIRKVVKFPREIIFLVTKIS